VWGKRENTEGLDLAIKKAFSGFAMERKLLKGGKFLEGAETGTGGSSLHMRHRPGLRTASTKMTYDCTSEADTSNTRKEGEVKADQEGHKGGGGEKKLQGALVIGDTPGEELL